MCYYSIITSQLLRLMQVQPIRCKCCPRIETSQLICCANQLTGFYMKKTMALNGLKLDSNICGVHKSTKMNNRYFV